MTNDHLSYFFIQSLEQRGFINALFALTLQHWPINTAISLFTLMFSLHLLNARI